MPTYKRFEELPAWNAAAEFAIAFRAHGFAGFRQTVPFFRLTKRTAMLEW